MAFTKNKFKTINDEIHSIIELPENYFQWIDTPQFARTSKIGQLGFVSSVYRSANHRRWEHLIGTAYLSKKWIEHLATTQPNLKISEYDQRMIGWSGLLHDLGHAPFSHAFEEWVHKSDPKFSNWCHEDMTKRMIEYTVEDNHIDIEKDDIHLLQSIIDPSDMRSKKWDDRPFLFEIVANKRTNIDTDKMDYLQRDALPVNKKPPFDPNYLFYSSRVSLETGRLCFHAKSAYSLKELFQTRYDMHRDVYQHRVSKSIELMYGKIFENAVQTKWIDLDEGLQNPEVFMTWTDSILDSDLARSKQPELDPSKKMLQRIAKRDLFCLIGEAIASCTNSQWYIYVKPHLTKESILSYMDTSINLQHFELDIFAIHMGNKNEFPLKNVPFFDWNHSQPFFLSPESIGMNPQQEYQNHFVRLYSTVSEKDPQCKKLESLLQKGWQTFIKNIGYLIPSYNNRQKFD